MAIEAPVSKFKKNNLKIFIVICVVLAAWFAYDGYFNEEFIKKNTDADGTPDSTLVFNQKAPPYLIGAAVLLAGYLFVISKKKVVAEENDLVINDKIKISYDSIQKIDKTNYDSKGFFIITYNEPNGSEANQKLSNRSYDDLTPVLEHLVGKIS